MSDFCNIIACVQDSCQGWQRANFTASNPDIIGQEHQGQAFLRAFYDMVPPVLTDLRSKINADKENMHSVALSDSERGVYFSAAVKAYLQAMPYKPVSMLKVLDALDNNALTPQIYAQFNQAYVEMQKDDRTHVTDSNQTKVLGLLCSSLAHSICTWGDLERVVVAEDKARLKQFQRDLAPLKISLPDGYSSVEQFGNALTEVQKAALAGFIAQQNVQGMFMAFAANQEDGFSIPAQQVEVKLMLSEEGDVTAQMRVPLQTSMSRTPIDDEAIILGDATIMLTVPKDARAWLDMNCALTIEPTEAGRAIIGAQLDPLARDVELFTSAPIASRNSSPLFVRRASKEAQNPVAQMTELYAAEPAKACVLAPVFINNLSLRDWEHERNAGNSGLGSLQKMLEKECPGHQKHLALETIEAQAARAPKTGVIKRLSGIFYKPPSPPQTPPLMNDLPDKRGEFPPQLPRSKSQSGSDRL